MRIQVDLIPGSPGSDVVIIVDALASCTAAAMLFDAGLEALWLTPSVRAARVHAASSGASLLGEKGGVPPEGFNLSSSPAVLAGLDFTGQQAVLMSDNAPKAVGLYGDAPHVLLGSLYNAGAVARLAARLATSEVRLVCCGFDGQEDLDDALAAGFIAAELHKLLPDSRFTGAARFTQSLLRAFPDPVEAFWRSAAGEFLRNLERSDDIGIAARVSASSSVPVRTGVSSVAGSAVHRFEADSSRR